jgi:hypothetical protein
MDNMTKKLVDNVESSLRRNKDNTPETSLQIDKFKKSVQSEESEIDEKWSKKYKDSIDCSNPKGFSQKAHCQGKKKKETNEKSDKRKKKEAVEATSSASSGQYSAPLFSLETPKDPLSKVSKVQESTVIGGETTEATSTSSSGQYSTPSWVAPNKKQWRGAAKTQIPGGKFVQIKKKCQTFPYCNQGDINALKLYENELVKESITNLSKKMGINENVIKAIIQYELEQKMTKRK